MSTKKLWKAVTVTAATGMMLAFGTPSAAPLSNLDEADRQAAPSAESLVRFYPTNLLSTPAGTVEDREVWLAKVQGLMTGAPALFQQSLLTARTKSEFLANLALLQHMQEGLLKQGGVDLGNQAKGTSGTLKLGASNSDLVYTALDPCRIMDTRSATVPSGVRGPITGNKLYGVPAFVTAGSNWGQYGGNGASDCGLNDSVGGNLWAVAIVITILNPNFDAFLGVSSKSDLSSVLSNVALNYTHGQGLSTLYIVPLTFSDNINFAMPAQLSAQLIFDVVGYFAVSQKTALDCTTVESGSTAVTAGSTFSITGPACPTGYTKTGPTFRSSTSSNLFVVNNFFDSTLGSFACQGSNGTAGSVNIQCGQVCCRVPGR